MVVVLFVTLGTNYMSIQILENIIVATTHDVSIAATNMKVLAERLEETG